MNSWPILNEYNTMKVQILKNWPVTIHKKKKKREKRTVGSRRSFINKNRQPFTFLDTIQLGNEKGLSGAEDL